MQIDESRPIWGQLVDEFRRRIVAGEWARGMRIPSVRELALELGVNPNTVQKALVEIDRAGLTIAERTSGRNVTTDAGAIASARAELASSLTDDYIARVAGLGMTAAAAAELLRTRWGRREEE